MKRALCAIISIVFTLLLCACTPKNPTITEPDLNTTAGSADTTASTAESIFSDITVKQLPMCAISLPVVTESEYAADGAEIFRYTSQNISLTLPDPDVADKVILNFLNRVDTTQETSESILSMAKSAYKPSSNWTPYQCIISYEPMRLDLGVLSMLGSLTTYSGASHPETVYKAVNYDLVSGNTLSIYTIMDFDAHCDTLFEYILSDLDDKAAAKNLYDGYEETVADLQNSAQLDNSWYFSLEGLCVFFPPYEIAPYASGVVTATIPYDKLNGILYDEHFPSERDLISGELLVKPFTQANAASFTQIAELILDINAEGNLLYTDTAIYDIRIDRGVWSASGATFTKQYTVFAASALTPGDAIMIEASLTETIPTLRIQYTSDGQLCTVYLTEENGIANLRYN